MASGSSGQGALRFVVRYWLPVLAYVAIIFALSAQARLAPPLHFQNSDKVMHLLEYGGLGLLLSRAVRASMPGRAWVTTALVTVALGMTVGACDEVFQSFVPGRESSVFDWFADSTGMVFAQLAFLAFAREQERE
ncbi:MAG: VanZ family protein [Candidatus Eisenbacteria bacterium]|uniref:VanZ family protein n=1 Tax=Eiseniibacteriota bacterium TaxID=2212470 RepID=A0A933W102_UNCEI|nr:VanZ family protein [Candidatus Eisenbacteria bacterium]